MAFQKLARAEEIPPGTTKFFRVDGRPIILAHWAGRFYALYGICPHQQNPFEGAVVWDYLLDCPWHHFQFDVRTGENHYPRNVYPESMPHLRKQVNRVATYPVEMRDGEVWVDVAPDGDE